MNTEQVKKENGTKVFIALLILLTFIVLVIVLITNKKGTKNTYMVSSSSSTFSQVSSKIIIEKLPVKGKVLLEQNIKFPVKKGQIITYTVYMDSAQTNVSAFDILVPYNSEFLKYTTSKSLMKDFIISTKDNVNYITITGFDAQQGKGTKASINGKVAEISFVAQQDISNISIRPIIYYENKERVEYTNFIDDKNTKYGPIIEKTLTK